MKACKDYREILYSDVYEEAVRSPDFEAHLKICSICRAEREELRNMIQTLKLRLPCPKLSPESAEKISASIMETLRKEAIFRGKKGLFPRLNPFIPVLAAASLMIAALGWFEFSDKAVSPPRSVSKINSEEQLIFKDFDVINDMELLEDMETIRKVVNAVDSGNSNKLLIKRTIHVSTYT